jgi:membrane-associated phospholipid phosphatase
MAKKTYGDNKMVNKKIALAFLLMLTFAAVLSYAASEYAILPFDVKSYQELQEQTSPWFKTLMQGISYLGEGAEALALTIIATAIFALRRQRLEAIFMLATTSNVLITYGLKDLIHRARPFPIAENSSGFIQSINQYGFPSGHVLFFVVFFGFFAYLAWIQFTGWVRVTSIAICAVLIVLIGPSRVFLGAHWATDVLGSYIIGSIWLFFLILAYQWAMYRKLNDIEV